MSKPSKSGPQSDSSRLLRVTVEGAIMSAVSNTLAQAFNFYRDGPSAIDVVAFMRFIILALITTPPNYKWQLWLEETFPSNPKRAGPKTASKKADDTLAKEETSSLSITNTAAKFFLDQTVGASLNTLWFIVMINLLRGQSLNHIITTVQRVSRLTCRICAGVLY